MPERRPQQSPDHVDVEAQMARLTRRSFAVGGFVALAGASGVAAIVNSALEGGMYAPLRRVMEGNERLAQALFSPNRLAPEFPREDAQEPRTNGRYGLAEKIDPAAWRLVVQGPDHAIPLAAIQELPRVEMVTELKCIEGWSVVVHWAGARLADFAAKYRLAGKYVSLQTPDRKYYVGLDIESALHPQTMLCYEMNGQPLAPLHGAPLRLVTTVKYGIKSIKRIGLIHFTDERPKDYWAERGYDWYAGH